ncbi:MAG: RHS repeat-associated core domain-containing protein, partial [Planctomycetota bacterium]
KYYPYGQERQTTYQDTEKFATYHRDATNLDYADQRYYTSAWGRFLTPDPSEPGDPAEPQSWNYYAYVLNDPVNLNDPEGLDVKLPPIVDVDRPTCLTRVFREVITPSGFGTTNDDNAHTNFFSSLEGTFGLSLFFETRPNRYTTDREDPYYQAMLGVGFTYINRYAAQWGAESGFHTLKKVIMDASTPIWERGAGDSRQMRGSYKDKLVDILNGSPNDDKDDCDGLIFSLHLGQSMVAHSVGITHSLPRQMYVYNPVGNALSFHSNRNPYPLPKYWNKNLRYTRTLRTPGGAFHFFELPRVNIWP